MSVEKMQMLGRSVVARDNQVRHGVFDRVSERPQRCQGVVGMAPLDSTNLAQRMITGADRFDGAARICQRNRQARCGDPANRGGDKDLGIHWFYRC